MCNPASFVLTKDAAFWSKTSDEHERIIEKFKLHADGVRGTNIVRVEINPPDGDMSKPLSKWIYHLDQEEKPDWYDPVESEKRARIALEEWAKARLIRTGESRLVRDARVFALPGSSVEALGNSSVVAWENSSVMAWGNSSVMAWGNSSVVAWENSSVVALENSSVVARENSSVEARGNSSVEALENSSVVARENSSVVARGNSSVTKIFGGVVRFFTMFSCTISGRFSVAIDMTRDAAVCHVGTDEERVVTSLDKP